MDTNLSTKEIELALRNCGLWNKRSDVMIPNLSWGLLNHEADFCVITKAGYLSEIEIKRSFADLKADFKKGMFHRDDRVYRFYYCIPLKIKEKAYELFDSHQEQICELYNTKSYSRPACLFYDENGSITMDNIWRSTRGGRKLFLEEREKIGRLMSLRYWSLLEKNKKEKENENPDKS